MNADKPEAGEAAHPDAAKEARAQLSSEDLRHSPDTWLVQESAEAYRCGKARRDERLRTVSAVSDKHGPQAYRKRDGPLHLYLSLARARLGEPGRRRIKRSTHLWRVAVAHRKTPASP